LSRPDRARIGIAGIAVAVIAGGMLASCGTGSAPSSASPTTLPGSISASTTTDQSVNMPKSSSNLRALPLGSRVYSTTITAVGAEHVCSPLTGTRPVKTPPWVDTAAATWSMTTKAAVAGDVTWSSSFRVTHSGTNLVLQGNDLPPRSGTFPVDPADPAYAYNPDLNPVSPHDFALKIPNDPTQNPTPACVPGDGAVGVMSNGVILLDGLDANGNDAGAVGTQDTCHGSPGLTGYHYVSLSPCLLSAAARTTTTQVGWARDGFGIYVEYGSNGDLLTNQDLDACHGRTSPVPWHGQTVTIYHYDMTLEYPYAVGCFSGTPSPLQGS
jgi:YHYH protein